MTSDHGAPAQPLATEEPRLASGLSSSVRSPGVNPAKDRPERRSHAPCSLASSKSLASGVAVEAKLCANHRPRSPFDLENLK